ncbi:hypothetical protein FA95DRAFT_1563585 [Auriscalpium vulgare]|uniref:Uncharacterized protein n=1 Tax=Auriscalpium vulgare TaxID=40419 RepID=A0ACB8RGX6_9AGAM|nr:hypothetical protein FA95DRAFT_1563585 [Auriscalpium vulgare]
MSRQFNDYAEDAHRLPTGMVRTAYDADTRQYTFRDKNGQLFVSAPGEEYGTLIPLKDAHRLVQAKGPENTMHMAPHRPVYFDETTKIRRSDDSGSSRSQPSTPPHAQRRPQRGMTFADILPPDLITPAPASPSEPGFSQSNLPSPTSSRTSSNHPRAASAPGGAGGSVAPVNKRYPGEAKSGTGVKKLRATASALGRSLTHLKRSGKKEQRDDYTPL